MNSGKPKIEYRVDESPPDRKGNQFFVESTDTIYFEQQYYEENNLPVEVVQQSTVIEGILVGADY
jgi:hypothetical protein